MKKYLGFIVLVLFGAVAAQADTATNFKAQCLACHVHSQPNLREGVEFPVSPDSTKPFTDKEKSALVSFLASNHNPNLTFGSVDKSFRELVDAVLPGGSGSHFSSNEPQILVFLDSLNSGKGFDDSVAAGDAAQ